MDYVSFLNGKTHLANAGGFDPLWMPEWLFEFQRHIVEWALRQGRSAVFADCGMGKTPMQLVWADNVVRKTNRPVLILTPLAVSMQTVEEAAKFGIDAVRCPDGKIGGPRIYVTNYERLHYFNSHEFGGTVCDESSILKNFEGATKKAVTEFMRQMQYRLLCTATAAPNDYIELGTSAEALGVMGFQDMLGMFFKNMDGNSDTHRSARDKHGNRVAWTGSKFRFRGHCEDHFWRWLCSWARALRKPSDLGFDDGGFKLPPLVVEQHMVDASRPMPGFLFVVAAKGLQDQRAERKHTLTERCEKAAELCNHDRPAVAWCHRNTEGDLLEKSISDCVQVSGRDSDDAKEEKFHAFAKGQVRALVTKPKIGAFGLNWQHCADTTMFPDHSFEQYYQAVRRFLRFGQLNTVRVRIVTTEGELNVMDNLQRKADAAGRMFDKIVHFMNEALSIERRNEFSKKAEVPSWLTT